MRQCTMISPHDIVWASKVRSAPALRMLALVGRTVSAARQNALQVRGRELRGDIFGSSSRRRPAAMSSTSG